MRPIVAQMSREHEDAVSGSAAVGPEVRVGAVELADVLPADVLEHAATKRASTSTPMLVTSDPNLACMATSCHSAIHDWMRLTPNCSIGRERLVAC